MHSKVKYYLLTIVFLLLAPTAVLGAENTYEHFFVEKSSQSFQVSEKVNVDVNNKKGKSSFTVLLDDQEVFNKEIEEGYVRSFYYFVKDNKEYILIEEKYDGTSSMLTFSLLKLENNQVEQMQESPFYVRGTIDVTNDFQLQVTYPKYKEGDSNASPSYMYRDLYTFSENGFTKVKTEDVTQYAKMQPKMSIQSSQNYKNPSYAEINLLLTRKAIEHNIPPEILKAVAYQESSWKHFENGKPHIGSDGIGIGIMQVSDHIYMDKNSDKYKNYVRRLMEDIEYNIDEGIRIFKGKWNNGGVHYKHGYLIPTINNNEPSILEDWYFAILAYNGRLERNDPIKNPLGSAYPAYQLRIYNHMKNFGMVTANIFPWNKVEDDVFYVNNSMYFKKPNYKMSGPFHKSNHLLKKGDIVRVTSKEATLKKNPNDEKATVKPNVGDHLVITSNQLAAANSWRQQYVFYKVKSFKDNKEYYVEAPYVKKATTLSSDKLFEYSGSGRYATSVLISKDNWKNSDVVVLARGDNAIDGLTGSVLASKYNAPLLLVKNDEIHKSVMDEMKRLKPKKIYILGGKSAISDNVEKKLAEIFGGKSVTRISGSGRYQTAVNIAQEIGSFEEVFIATGNENSPDALSIGGVAGQKQGPILLSDKNGLSQTTINFLKKHKNVKVYLVGGENVVPNKVINQLKEIGITKVERVSGSDRYQTSTAIAKKFPMDNKSIMFVSGESFVDALPGGPLAVKMKSPIILTPTDYVPWTVTDWINKNVNGIPSIYFLGGNKVITPDVRLTLQRIIIESLGK